MYRPVTYYVLVFAVAVGMAGCTYRTNPGDGPTDPPDDAADDTATPEPDARDTAQDGSPDPDTVAPPSDTVADSGPNDSSTADTADSGTEDTGRDLSGSCTVQEPRKFGDSLSLHPTALKLDPNGNLDGAELKLTSALSFIGGSSTPLIRDPGQGSCRDATTTFSTTATKATWSLDRVEVDSVSRGILGLVDSASSGSNKFVRTASAIVGSEIAQKQVSAATNADVFAVTDGTIDEIASISPKTRQELLQDGLILGRFVDSAGRGVENLQIGTVSGGTVSTISDAMYIDDTYTKITTGGATASNGVFLLTGRSLNTYGGKKQGDSSGTLVTESRSAATVSDTVLVLTLQLK